MVLYDERGNFLVGGQLPLATRKGRQIPNDRRMEQPPARLRAAKEIFERRATVRSRSLTGVYNCMGMVFASRRTCVEPEYLQMILEDDEYHRLSSPDQAVPGDVVVYRDDQRTVVHVGLVAQVIPNLRREGTSEIVVLSQWGADGEYVHRVDDVHPSLGAPAEYWSDRK